VGSKRAQAVRGGSTKEFNAVANITLATKPQGTLASLDSLAATVRSAHTAVGLAARKVLDHALTAGDALLAAKVRDEFADERREAMADRSGSDA
jgi:hypothetical protein